MKILRLRMSAPKKDPLAIKRYIGLRLNEQGLANLNWIYEQLKDCHNELGGKPSLSMVLLLALENVTHTMRADPKRLQGFICEIIDACQTRYPRQLKKGNT